MTIYELAAKYREDGVPIHLRSRSGKFSVYYGYAPAIATGLSEREVQIVLRVVAQMHHELTKAVAA